MRDIDVNDIAARVRQAVQDLNFHTPQPALIQLAEIMESEPSPAGRLAMHDIVQNRAVASARQVPMCQDTGMAIVFVELGQDVHLVGGDGAERNRHCAGTSTGSIDITTESASSSVPSSWSCASKTRRADGPVGPGSP